MKEQPIDTIPIDRKILVKHKKYGWIQVRRARHGDLDNDALTFWLHTSDISAWAELPEEPE